MMNLYLIYISTVISSYIFNTYNYIKNRINVERIKKRKLIFKKNLCSDAERTVKQADMVPTIYYLKASLIGTGYVTKIKDWGQTIEFKEPRNVIINKYNGNMDYKYIEN